MLQRGHHESGQEKKNKKISGQDGGTRARSGARGSECCVPQREHRASAAVTLEAEVPSRRHRKLKKHQARAKAKRRSGDGRTESRKRNLGAGAVRNFNRASCDEKKESLGLDGALYGRHLSKAQRESLFEFIDEQARHHSVAKICGLLEIHPRSYYRWRENNLKENHGGGGGKNKITPKEELAVVRLARQHPEWHCRRIAYSLEKNAKAFIGKTKVAEIMKAHGLSHPFVQKPTKIIIPPEDMLLHEPWKSNLVWGMDWTWITVDGKFMFLLVLLDWHSRKILSWGLHHKITQNEVVTLVTEAVALERIDFLPQGALKPFVVADHGSANIAAYTRVNIEVQGLKLWLSGIGRPTGNARTERVMGTLKREEIYLQEQYENETIARELIGAKIYDYNFHRPNQGNGGFAPNSVHHMGRHELTKRRERARQKAQDLRRRHWEQDQSPSNTMLT
jgi:putative transposase